MSVLIFGDSFVGPFTLLTDSKIKIFKFKGATMKGLDKSENQNRLRIIELVEKNLNSSLLFTFGQVDLYFSYYYQRYVKQEKFMAVSIAKNYVKFIDSLPIDNKKKTILSVYPTTLKDENVFLSLVKYGIISPKLIEMIPEKEKEKATNFNFRYKMYSNFNKILEESCKKYGINFVSLEKKILNKNKRLHPRFINDINPYSIHLMYEPLINILLNSLKHLKIKRELKIDPKKSIEKYRKEKISIIDL